MGRHCHSGSEPLKNESVVPPILNINFTDPLFSVAAHPTRPILVSGLGTGHVFCHTYNPEKLEESLATQRASFLSKDANGAILPSQLRKTWWKSEDDHANLVNGDLVNIGWKTKRHKGSCRSVIFDTTENSVGEHLFTVGTDDILKKAKTETGKVLSKIDISAYLEGVPKDAITTLSMSSIRPFLVAGTENGSALVFDSNNLSASKLTFRVDNIQEDAINKILPMPAVSDYHFLALGSTKLAHIDIRKGIITQSEDQADELLSMCFPTEYINSGKNDAVLVSHGEGVVTYWKNSANGLSDQLSRVRVNKNASIDSIISTMDSGDEDMMNSVWCGDSEGYLHRVDYKKGKVMESRVHSSLMSKSGAVDEVGGLDIDFEYRLVSSGMESLKIWSGQSLYPQTASHAGEEPEEFSNTDNLEQTDLGSYSELSGSEDEDESVTFGVKHEAQSGFEEIKPENKPCEHSKSWSSGETITTTKRRRSRSFQNLQKAKKTLPGEQHEAQQIQNLHTLGGNGSLEKKKKKIATSNGIAKFEGL